jgi:hypothetical protein
MGTRVRKAARSRRCTCTKGQPRLAAARCFTPFRSKTPSATSIHQTRRVAPIDQVTAGSVEGYGDGTPGPWYQGTVPIQDLMQRMYGGNTYLEVHTDSVPGGEFRAGLGTPSFLAQPEDPATWQAIYCS